MAKLNAALLIACGIRICMSRANAVDDLNNMREQELLQILDKLGRSCNGCSREKIVKKIEWAASEGQKARDVVKSSVTGWASRLLGETAGHFGAVWSELFDEQAKIENMTEDELHEELKTNGRQCSGECPLDELRLKAYKVRRQQPPSASESVADRTRKLWNETADEWGKMSKVTVNQIQNSVREGLQECLAELSSNIARNAMRVVLHPEDMASNFANVTLKVIQRLDIGLESTSVGRLLQALAAGEADTILIRVRNAACLLLWFMLPQVLKVALMIFVALQHEDVARTLNGEQWKYFEWMLGSHWNILAVSVAYFLVSSGLWSSLLSSCCGLFSLFSRCVLMRAPVKQGPSAPAYIQTMLRELPVELLEEELKRRRIR